MARKHRGKSRTCKARTSYPGDIQNRTYEEAARAGELTAEVVVAPWGQAKLAKRHINRKS